MNPLAPFRTTAIRCAFVASVATIAVSLSARDAFAQEAVDRNPGDRQESSAPRPSLPEQPPLAPGEPPLGQTGFQAAFRTGVAIPAAKIGGSGQSMTDVFAPQFPVVVELGAKPIQELFVGVYGGFGVGGVAGTFDQQCSAAGVSCSAHTFRAGVEAIVHLLPARRIDPWFGYGIGFEQSTVIVDANERFATTSVSGLELAHLMTGMDVRISHSFGIGPYADIAIGRYTHLHEDMTQSSPYPSDTDIADPATHLWVSLGARAVVFP